MLGWIQEHWRHPLMSVGVVATAIVLSLLARALIFWVLRRLTQREGAGVIGPSLLRHSERPSHWILPLLAVMAVLPGLPLPPGVMSALEHIAGLGLIATMAWLAILLIELTADILAGRYRIDVADNLLARRVQTQFQMVHRIAVLLVVVACVAVMLMTFPSIKHIGMSILASAGLASLVVGVSMKDTLANLVAGVQIAFAQPFRLGDAVVVEGEWGWIEEIGTMYVIVRIWDLRRLVLPLSYFLDHPFQNWTYKSADLLAYTYLYTDYTAPVEAVRTELRRICEATPLWAGKVCGVQVSDCDQHTMQLRALMDARNSGEAWDLRCLVREKLIDFMQRNYPGSLPRYRAEVAGGAEGGLEGKASEPTAERVVDKRPRRMRRDGANMRESEAVGH
jgi:small-conductance mechanosensitive channel